MKTKTLALIALPCSFLLFACSGSGSSWLEELGNSALDRAESKSKSNVEDRVNQSVDRTVDASFEQAEKSVEDAVN